MKTKFFSLLALASLPCLLMNCQQATQTADISQGIFPQGTLGPSENFTGKAWNLGLVANDTTYQTLVGNVYFEPGARSNWHTHPSGQILIITDGVGYHQLKGQARQTIRKGDVVKCPPNTLHWHGASQDSGMQQMYIIPKTEKGIVQWLQPVTDKEYNGGK
ncbi:cupin domain-containing protein [Emticicia agri]|uniref:Cupin domain-containing protein n=1 Tax=Emticicia agri TaxID=2492393 RepID=A0A4Q5LVW2_9BACT|nr:cupin domain-containing protein [Emticicia agri]RYU93613.1 cupin domain-containing protein [Emticicia agri]